MIFEKNVRIIETIESSFERCLKSIKDGSIIHSTKVELVVCEIPDVSTLFLKKPSVKYSDTIRRFVVRTTNSNGLLENQYYASRASAEHFYADIVRELKDS